MATILEFRPAEQQTAEPPHETGARRSGEIVIFPGVRYERGDQSPKQERRRATRNRDLLELVD